MKKNILMLIPNLDFGGAQSSFCKVSNLLSLHHNIINVVFNKRNIAEYKFNSPLIDLEIYPGSTAISKITSFFRRVVKLRKIKKEYGIDVSISFLEGADYVNVLSCIKERTILSIRGSKKFDQNINGWLGFVRLRWLMPTLYNKANHITVVTKGIAEELSSHFGIKTKIEVINNFYDLESLKGAANELAEDDFLQWVEKKKVICILGRLAPEKGIDRFLPVFKRLKSDNDLRLLIIGDGPLLPSLINQSKQLGLNANTDFEGDSDVVFFGYRSNPHKYLRHCSMLTLPSLHEGFPNVLLEAMCLGVPVSSADCPYGPREILKLESDEYAGLLLPILTHKSEEEWVIKMKLLLKNEIKREELAQKGAARANHFVMENPYNQWLSLIDG